MRSAGLALACGALSALSACSWFGSSSQAPVESGQPKPRAVQHPEAQFLVSYGTAFFRVNVRYVPLIDESVIAVREGVGEAVEQGWRTLQVAPSPEFRPGVNFADSSYEDVVVEIAGEVQAAGGICAEGQSISMATNRDGEIRTLYRSNRQVWVVFALCPEQAVSEAG
ncbi:MAG: hypothetical protein AAF074_24735 [Pseudomonadota bacterium]